MSVRNSKSAISVRNIFYSLCKYSSFNHDHDLTIYGLIISKRLSNLLKNFVVLFLLYVNVMFLQVIDCSLKLDQADLKLFHDSAAGLDLDKSRVRADHKLTCKLLMMF